MIPINLTSKEKMYYQYYLNVTKWQICTSTIDMLKSARITLFGSTYWFWLTAIQIEKQIMGRLGCN